MPLTLLKLAFTRSGGTVSKTAWVLQVINYIKKNSKCSCRNCITLIVRWPIVLKGRGRGHSGNDGSSRDRHRSWVRSSLIR